MPPCWCEAIISSLGRSPIQKRRNNSEATVGAGRSPAAEQLEANKGQGAALLRRFTAANKGQGAALLLIS